MWRRHSSRLNITVLFSGYEHGGEKWLTEWPGVRYPQKQENTGFFSNVTTALPPLGLVGDMRVPFWGQRSYPLTPQGPQIAQNGKAAA
jgi:hypothetical protein